MSKFKVGDRVKVINQIAGVYVYNHIGTIIYIPEKSLYGIKFDKDIGGHNLMHHCEKGFGWWIFNSTFIKKVANVHINFSKHYKNIGR